MSQSPIRHLSVPLLILSCAALSGCGVEEEKASNADTAEHQGHNSDTASPRDTAQDTGDELPLDTATDSGLEDTASGDTAGDRRVGA